MKMENKEHKEVEEQAKETQTQNATETEKELTDAEKLEAANEEIAQLKDKYLRQVAEFDNYRMPYCPYNTDYTNGEYCPVKPYELC